jgi:hypothetical protein
MRRADAFRAVLGILLIASSAGATLWTTPVAVSEVNTAGTDGAPFLTYDGLSLYFFRPDVSNYGLATLYGATRSSPSGTFGSVQEFPSLNASTWNVSYAWVSADNKRMYYYQSLGETREIFEAQRANVTDPWSPGVGVAELNGLINNQHIPNVVVNPSLTPDELTIVFAGFDLPGGKGTNYDIWMGTRTSTSNAFGNFTDLSQVNTGSNDLHPRLSADGSTLYFASNRNGSYELFQATRPNTQSSFGTPAQLSFLGVSGSAGQYPDISADGQTLYFVEGPNVGTGYDIYVSHAVPAPGAVVLGLVGLVYAGWRCRRETV